MADQRGIYYKLAKKLKKYYLGYWHWPEW